MSVLKLKRNGKNVGKWYVEFKDNNQIVRRIPAYTDKSESSKLEGKIKDLVNYRLLSKQPDPKLLKYFDTLPDGIRNRLINFGLIDAAKVNARLKSLVDYLDEFEQTIRLNAKKDKTGKQAKLTKNRVKKVIEGCEFSYWTEVTGENVDMYICKLRTGGFKNQTAQFYVKAFRRFVRWMVSKGYGTPLKQDVKSISVPKGIERAFEFDEYAKLLNIARTGPDSYGLTGYQRYLLYQLAVETGLRRGELRSLTPVSFNFKGRTVFVKGDDTKNCDDAEQDISPEMAQLMQEYIKGKMPTIQLFNIHDKSSKMIQADCRAAGIRIENVKGKIKFHTLRHTCGSFLIAQGVNLKIIQEVMRHKSIDITISRYGHLMKGQKKSAIAGLGKLSVKHAATGTD